MITNAIIIKSANAIVNPERCRDWQAQYLCGKIIVPTVIVMAIIVSIATIALSLNVAHPNRGSGAFAARPGTDPLDSIDPLDLNTLRPSWPPFSRFQKYFPKSWEWKLSLAVRMIMNAIVIKSANIIVNPPRCRDWQAQIYAERSSSPPSSSWPSSSASPPSLYR